MAEPELFLYKDKIVEFIDFMLSFTLNVPSLPWFSFDLYLLNIWPAKCLNSHVSTDKAICFLVIL